MKTLLDLAEDPATARKLNAVLAELYSERGVPERIIVDSSRQALIAHFATGPIVIHPLKL